MRTLVRFGVAVVIAGLGLAASTILLVPQARALFTAGSIGKDKILSLKPLSQRSVVYARDGSTWVPRRLRTNRRARLWQRWQAE